jgi:hypothetical protein
MTRDVWVFAAAYDEVTEVRKIQETSGARIEMYLFAAL